MSAPAARKKPYSAGLAILTAAPVLLTACINQGPMGQLRSTMAAISTPTELQPAKVSPWKGFDWTTLEMDNGVEALTWEGPHGIDNETAWLVSGWTVTTDAASSDTAQNQACETLIALAEQNAPALDPEQSTDTLNRCQNKKWPSGRTFDVSWHLTTDDVPIKVAAVLRRTPADSYSLVLDVKEER